MTRPAPVREDIDRYKHSYGYPGWRTPAGLRSRRVVQGSEQRQKIEDTADAKTASLFPP